MKDTDIAYAAGIIDADGSIQAILSSRSRAYTMVRVTVTQVDERLGLFFMKLFGHGHSYRFESPASIGKGYWHQWSVCALQAKAVLLAVRPYLLLKQRQADLALELMALMATQKNRGRHGLSDADINARLLLVQEIRQHNTRPRAARVPLTLDGAKGTRDASGRPAYSRHPV